jgi:hypothetical protein
MMIIGGGEQVRANVGGCKKKEARWVGGGVKYVWSRASDLARAAPLHFPSCCLASAVFNCRKNSVESSSCFGPFRAKGILVGSDQNLLYAPNQRRGIADPTKIAS